MSIKVFVSYSNDDQEHVKRLMKEVGSIPHAPRIRWLTDYEHLRAGDRVDPKIRRLINEADIWVLLFSPRFRESEYCTGAELPLLKQTNDVRCNEGRRPGLRPILLEEYGKSGEMDLLRSGPQRVSVIAHDSPILQDSNALDERWKRTAANLVLSVRDLAVERGLVTRTELSDFWPEMQRGQLTPFLGPSYGDTREHYERALPHLRSRLQQLLNVLPVPEDDDARQYATAVATSRKVELTDHDKGSPAVALPKEFVQLQAAIARLGAKSCAVFADALGRAHQGVTDTKSYTVALSEVQPRLVHELAQSTLDATVAAGVVRQLVDRDSHSLIATTLSLSAGRIQAKLVTLASIVFGLAAADVSDKLQDLDAWLVAFKERLQHLDGSDTSGRIALSHLEWLGDLLWHTLRFDAPLFPSPDDFAFQLAMCSSFPHSVARLDLGLAAIVGRNEFSIEGIVAYFDRLVRKPLNSDGAESLSSALGEMLRQGFRRNVSSNSQATEGSAAKAVKALNMRSEEGSQPLLLTLTMDRDVEYYLDQLREPYFTLFPVSYSELPTGTVWPDQGDAQLIQPERVWSKPAWLLAAFKCPGAANDPEFFYIAAEVGFEKVANDVRSMLGFSDSRSNLLPGPLIAHLHGAPLIRLPNKYTADFLQITLDSPASNTLGRVKFEHRILLSPLDYSRELIGLQSPPKCLADLMADDRVLFFLGHALGEPHGLSGLQTDVWLRRDRDGLRHSVRGERVSADGHSPDDVRTAVLANMGITALRITLDDVGRELMQTLASHA